jgi:uronate dehydrogenase
LNCRQEIGTIMPTRTKYNRILLTGASGYLGTVLRPALRALSPAVRLTDVVPLKDAPASGEEYVRAELADPAQMHEAMRGVDAVVHLGGVSVEAAWEPVLQANIIGTYNVFEAARQAGVRRVVYASSHHAVGYYRRERRIGGDEPVRPDSRYGVSKVFGEALGRMYADKYGMSVVAQRIGVARPQPPHPRGLLTWVSERDYVQLTQRCLEAPDVHYLVVYGVSANDGALWNNEGALSIGYTPQDNAAHFAPEVLAATPAEAEPALERPFHGGWFCAMEFAGDPARIA